MARRQITYARKKARNKKHPALTSSPLQTITDPEENLTHSQMALRMLKRSRQASSFGSPRKTDGRNSKKKHKIDRYDKLGSTRKAVILGPPTSQLGELQTPLPTTLSEDQIFKLESSRGITLPDGYEYSPVPLATRDFEKVVSLNQPQTLSPQDQQRTKPSRKRSSRNLKENSTTAPTRSLSKSSARISLSVASRTAQTRPKSRITTNDKLLASPFASRPSSPYSLVRKKPNIRNKISITAQPELKRTLSDTRYDPNIPFRLERAHSQLQAQSTTNSPARHFFKEDSFKTRRPSAPSATAPRLDVSSWFTSCSPPAKFDSQNERILSSSIFGLGAPNRGPVDFNRPPSQLSYNFDYDDAFADDALAVSTPFGSKPQDIEFDSPLSTDEEDGTRVSYMHGDFQISLQSGILGSWMSDSLIFRPTLSVKDAYTQVSSPYKDVDMDLCEYLVNDDNENCLRPQSEAEVNKTRHEALQELFTSLDLGTSCTQISRTRSLDLELDRPQNGQPLQSPAHISPLKSKNLAAEREKHGGRNRRSTLRASDFPAPNCTASAVGGPRRTRSGTVVQGPTAPRRERSGTILARPPVLRPINATAAALSKNRDIEIDKTDGHNVTQGTDDVLMSSDDDELLLKGHWCDEDWLVAAPPSPELRSQSTRKNAARKRRYGLAKGLGTWGMKEHDEDDGMDDPLLLK